MTDVDTSAIARNAEITANAAANARPIPINSTRAADTSAVVRAWRQGTGAVLVLTAKGNRGGERAVSGRMADAQRRELIIALGGTPNE